MLTITISTPDHDRVPLRSEYIAPAANLVALVVTPIHPYAICSTPGPRAIRAHSR
jgi:hypothetical protein